MIGRIWHGWTKPENADEYEWLLKEEIFPEIGGKKVPGYRGIQLFRRPLDNFSTLSRTPFYSPDGRVRLAK